MGRYVSACAQVFGHRGDEGSARHIANSLIDLPSIVLALQTELIDYHIPLANTTAGEELGGELAAYKRKVEEEIAKLNSDYQQALRNRDRQSAADAADQRLHFEAQLRDAKHCQEAQRISLEHLVAEKTAKCQALITQSETERAHLHMMLEDAERQVRQARLDREKQDTQHRQAQTD